MPVPNHSSTCQTLMFPINCPDCGESVYYFACTCGSKVFFDLNQPPWIPHERRCWRYLIRILRDEFNFPESYIPTMIDNYAESKSLIIPPDVQIFLDSIRHDPEIKLISNKITVKEIPPFEGTTQIVGEIHNINKNINFFKKLKIGESIIGKQLIRRYAEHSYLEVMIRVGKDKKIFSDYCCYIKLDDFQSNGTMYKRKDLVVVDLKCENILNILNIWSIESIFLI